MLKTEELTTNNNKKIWVAKVSAKDYHTIDTAITELMQDVAGNNHQAVVQLMKQLLPDYISNNSIYEELDVPSKPNKKATV